MESAVVLVAAGEGRRFGRSKALAELGGIPLVVRAAAGFARFRLKVAVLREDDLDRVALPGWQLVAGGARRRDSVAAGLDALGLETGTVLIHDAARPLLPAAVLDRVLAAAATSPAVIPVLPVTDTLKRIDGRRVAGTIDREALAAVQTPQAFRVDLLRRALAASSEDATDEATLVERLGEPVVTVAGDPRNVKITTLEDLQLAEALAAHSFR